MIRVAPTPDMGAEPQGRGWQPRRRGGVRLVLRLREAGGVPEPSRRRGEGGARARPGLRQLRGVAPDVGERMEVSERAIEGLALMSRCFHGGS